MRFWLPIYPIPGLPVPIFGSSKYFLKTQLTALPTSGISQIEYFKFSRRIALWGIGFGTKTINEYNRSNPAGFVQWDAAPGSTQSIKDRTDGALNTGLTSQDVPWFLTPFMYVKAGLNLNVTQDLFSFVSTTSALDAPVGTPINTVYVFPGTGTAGTSTQGYIAQKKFAAASNTYYNANHTDFTARNALWLFNEMENISQTYDCEDYCQNNMSITGTSQLCTSAIYRVNGLSPAATVTWSATPSNMVVFNCDTCPETTVTRYGTGTVTLSAVVSGCGGGAPIEVVKSNINVGAPNTSSYKVIGPGTVYTYAYYYYSATGGPGSGTVSWSVPAGWSITNGQGTENITVYTGSAGGVVSINFTDVCGDPTGAYKTVVIGSGGPTPLKVSPLTVAVSPNPATNQVSISLQAAETINKQSTPDFISQIKIFDKMGTERKQFTYNDKKVSRLINIAGLPKDVYVVKVFTGNQWLSTQLIILK